VNAATSWWNENAAYNIAGACSSGNVCGTCTPTAAIPECGHYSTVSLRFARTPDRESHRHRLQCIHVPIVCL